MLEFLVYQELVTNITGNIVRELFRGVQCYTTQCNTCRRSSSSQEDFYYLPVHPKVWSTYNDSWDVKLCVLVIECDGGTT